MVAKSCAEILAGEGEEGEREWAHLLHRFTLHLRQEVGEGEGGACPLDEGARTKKKLIAKLKEKKRRGAWRREGEGGRSGHGNDLESRFQ